jgi:cytochrome c oxidase subunit 2
MDVRVVLFAIAASIIGIVLLATVGMYYGQTPPSSNSYGSNGELIYMTGYNEDGEKIEFTGGPQWLYMHGGSCVACHGPRGEGGIVPMMCNTQTPAITYDELVEHGMTEEDMRKAITLGVDDDGKPLDPCMPRWVLSEKDLNDLVDYLKELSKR